MDIFSLLLRHVSTEYYLEPNKHLSACIGKQGEEKIERKKDNFQILLKQLLHENKNASDIVKVMKHLENFAKLVFHEYLGQISQISSVNFCQWKVAICRFNLVTSNRI